MTDRHYPATRLRRLRSQAFLRDLVREHRLSPADLILPVFIREGQGIREPVASMPGVVRQSLDQLVITAREAADAGLPALVLFPLIEAAHKSEDAAAAWDPDGLVPRAIQAHNKAITHKIIAAHPVEFDQILDPDRAGGCHHASDRKSQSRNPPDDLQPETHGRKFKRLRRDARAVTV